ncbi:DeoR family fructose operon transcriptional repressor [Breznakia sp. PF5-3]|uniref:DeoR/GlpR family DNA-binding transcription regulator n=1 Tax=unclassified Breznakia TaxID=2623764 RepID=UPI002405938C|nr:MULTISPECIES: DeoR/GlpR family DNA-binding transcription regulator [unclassified Breznakia]MDL2276577.1 DeoR/GlpR family DNA-binding transcription regulator [Breznakia sp. OttesenSCG-928-G09]MDF9823853.1 DeoR family fructose operon transcriptional repressor [Breznakia sp. PM6-1]MDF9834581.1 DeoR family fructose operon transcriptional repressor [Breznakia sp. PF5-3]MDF9836802.1 DeoR family fructose operon transcriptional repressor [Breznakia sp. PFB2-8]MDF9858749.1 DeoR family fructose opero
MLAYERQAKILDILLKNDVYTIEQFLKVFPKVSASTIRRDLKFLESENKIILFHGGDVRLKKSSYEDAFATKKIQNMDNKVRLAKYAASLIKNGDVVYLDSSTTVMEMLQFINKEVTLVTNFVNFTPFQEFDYNVIKIGGSITKTSLACFDSLAKEMIKTMNFDIAFVGCGGIDSKYGITFPTIEQAIYERQVKKQSLRYIVLADESKFYNVFSGKAFDIDECEIYTDILPKEVRKRKNIHIIE